MPVNYFLLINFLTAVVYLNSVTATALIQQEPSIQNVIKNDSIANCISQQYEWECCANYTSKETGTISVCVFLKYLPKEFGGEVKVIINNFVALDEKVTLVNPPPLCMDIPYLEKIAKACIYLYNMSLDEEHLSGCAKVTATVTLIKVFEFKIGCFFIPLPPISDEKSPSNLKKATTNSKSMFYLVFIFFLFFVLFCCCGRPQFSH